MTGFSGAPPIPGHTGVDRALVAIRSPLSGCCRGNSSPPWLAPAIPATAPEPISASLREPQTRPSALREGSAWHRPSTSGSRMSPGPVRKSPVVQLHRGHLRDGLVHKIDRAPCVERRGSENHGDVAEIDLGERLRDVCSSNRADSRSGTPAPSQNSPQGTG